MKNNRGILYKAVLMIIAGCMSMTVSRGIPVRAGEISEETATDLEVQNNTEAELADSESTTWSSDIMSSSMWDYDPDSSTLNIYVSDSDVDEAEFPDTGYLDFKTNIKKVIIATGITNIPEGAFKGCTALEEVEIADTVTRIGERAFSGCTALETISIPDSVTEIGKNALSSCVALKTVRLPQSLIEIPEYLFSGCSSLTGIDIPDSVKSIGDGAFQNCDSIEEITFSENIEYFGKNVLKDCDNLAILNYNSEGASRSSADAPYLVKACASLRTIHFGNNVSKIPDYFLDSCGIRELDLPDTIHEIGEYAYYQCNNLTVVDIPESITKIGGHAFHKCSGITEITIPETVTDFGMRPINECTSLEVLNYNPESLNRTAEEYIVSKCANLTTIYFGEKVTELPDYFLLSCGISDLSIPDSITRIGSHAFQKCNGITQITIPETVTEIGSSAICTCSSLETLNYNANLENREKDAYIIKDCESLSEINYGGNVTAVPDYFLCNCGISELNLPDSITGIGDYAFSNCDNIEKVDLPDHITTTGDHAFYACNGITEMTIPASIVTFKGAIISQCDNLTSLAYYAKDAQNSTNNALINGCHNLVNISFGKDVTAVPAHFMDDCGIKTITEDILLYIREIGSYAFMNCTDFTDIWIPENVKVGNYAFKGCTNLTVHGYAYYGDTASTAKTMAAKCNCKFESIDEHTWGTPKKSGDLLVYTCTICGTVKYKLAKDTTKAYGAWSGGATYTYSSSKGKFILDQAERGNTIKLQLKKTLTLAFNGKGIKSCKSSNSKVVKAKKVTDGTVTITGKKIGNATLTIKDENNKSHKFTVRVRNKQPINCKTKSTIRVKKSRKSFTIKASCPSKHIKFTSSKKSVATVTKKGKVKIKGTGTTTITIHASASKKYFDSIKQIKIIVKK